jgi:hypothetical protein
MRRCDPASRDMKHEWSPEHEIFNGDGKARCLSFCRACGLLHISHVNYRTRRSAEIYAMTSHNADTIVHVEEPSCIPDRKRRTLPKPKHQPPPSTQLLLDAEQIEIALLEREVSFEQWRDLSGAQRMVHLSKYIDGARTNLYGPVPRTHCGELLHEITWTTVDLVKEANRRLWRDGDAICVACIEKTRRRDR